MNYRPKDTAIEQLTDFDIVRLHGEEFTRSRRDNFKKILARSSQGKGRPSMKNQPPSHCRFAAAILIIFAPMSLAVAARPVANRNLIPTAAG